MKEFIKGVANAKINLHLNVHSKRTDGYHPLSSVMQSVSLFDEIEIIKTKVCGVEVLTEGTQIIGDNLVKKAAEEFLAFTGINCGVKILLKKHIPLFSGLGGGSADAAATFILLNALFNAGLDEEKLNKMALSVGADVPFCLYGGTKTAQGIGEKLSKTAPLCEMDVVLIKEGNKASTGYMYAQIDDFGITETDDLALICRNIKEQNYSELQKNCFNSFLNVSPNKEKQQKIIDELYNNGAVLAGLSGSGPTVFGLFEQPLSASFKSKLTEKYKEIYFCKTADSGIKIIKSE